MAAADLVGNATAKCAIIIKDRASVQRNRPQIAMPGGPAASALAEEPHRFRLGRLLRVLGDSSFSGGGYQNV
jgi:hypothetical protein